MVWSPWMQRSPASSLPSGMPGVGCWSWQCHPAWQSSHSPDLSGFENRMGTRRTFVFSSGAGTGPSGCSWDVTASRLLPGGESVLRHPGRPRCTLALFPFRPSVAEPEALPVLSCSQAGWGCSPGPPAGTSGSREGTAFSWKPHQLSSWLTCPASPGEVSEFVPLLNAKHDCCPRWHRALN